MKFSGVAAALLCSVALAGCGGEGSSGGSSGPATGGGGSTPTPTPTFTYTKFADLTGDQDFPTACIDAEPSQIGTITNAQPRQMGVYGAVMFADATDTYTITNLYGFQQGFGPADLFDTTANSDEYRKPSGLGPDHRLQIFRNSETGLTFEYMRSAFAILFEQGRPPVYTSCVFGVATDPDDVPSDATVTYTDLRFGGSVIDEAPGQTPPSTYNQIVGGTGTLTGNTQTGDVTIEFSLTIEDASGAQSTIGPFQGTVTTEINGDVAGYSGLINVGGAPEILVAGGYFGPEGRETGFSFHGAIDQNADGIPERSIFGGVAAKR